MLSTAALLCLLELALRLWLGFLAPDAARVKYARAGAIPAELSRYVPHPYLCYALNPRFASSDGKDRHNALGFRGAEFARAKPAGRYRIVCLGGSSVYDTEIPDWSLAFPAQLERALAALGHAEVEVVNGGVGGYTSFETLVDVSLRILELEPDLLVVYHNSNDVHARLVSPADFASDNGGYRHAWTAADPWWDRATLVRYLGVQWGFSPRNSLEERTKVTLDEERDLEACLAANSPRWFVRNLRAIATLARARGTDVLLATFASCPEHGGYPAVPTYQRGIAENNVALTELAAELELACYDFAAEMPRDLALWDDGVHNTAAGAARKAELFAAFLAPRFLAATGGQR